MWEIGSDHRSHCGAFLEHLQCQECSCSSRSALRRTTDILQLCAKLRRKLATHKTGNSFWFFDDCLTIFTTFRFTFDFSQSISLLSMFLEFSETSFSSSKIMSTFYRFFTSLVFVSNFEASPKFWNNQRPNLSTNNQSVIGNYSLIFFNKKASPRIST